MMATEELRRLLDESGIDWEDIPIVGNYMITRWHTPDGHIATYCEDWRGCTVAMDATPKQAIAATLGRNEPPYDHLIERLREDWGIEASWDGLRRFWCVQLTEESVRLRDEREAELGRGTCRMILREDIRGHAYQDTYECSVCGEQVIRETYMGESEPPRYCPSCGREVER